MNLSKIRWEHYVRHSPQRLSSVLEGVWLLLIRSIYRSLVVFRF